MEGAKPTTRMRWKPVATRAIQRKTGACGLRSIMEMILLTTMFELPGLADVEEVVVEPAKWPRSAPSRSSSTAKKPPNRARPEGL